MKPAGYVGSVRTLPSILMSRCATIEVTSCPVKAYFSLFLRKTVRGRDSRSLCGPGEGRGACIMVHNQAYRLEPKMYFVHRFPPVCRASMMRVRSNASSAFLVPGPSRTTSVLYQTSHPSQSHLSAFVRIQRFFCADRR